jgi:hypothetical protein
MADKKVTLSIAGKEVVCNFGVNYLYKFFKEVTGKDLMVDGLTGITTSEVFDIVPALFYSGYKADRATEKQPAELTHEDFSDHFYAGDVDLVQKAFTDYMDVISPGWNDKKDEPGEAQPQAAQP